MTKPLHIKLLKLPFIKPCNCLPVAIFVIACCHCLLPTSSFSQLIINEVSQGTTGSQEYVEFLVYGTPSCTSSCVDLRGWIFDDNNGWHVPGPVGINQGIAAGCMRFSMDTMWSCIPIGTLIVVYNEAEPNPALPPNDPTDADSNCVYILTGNSTLFDRNDTAPNTTALIPYSTIIFTNGGIWIRTGMRNTGDTYQTVDPNNTTAPYFSIGWGDNTVMQNIYFSGAATGIVMYMANAVDNDPFNQSNWVAASASANQTPGAPNNPANAAWINSMNNNCSVASPLVIDTVIPLNVSCNGLCNGSATVNTSGGTPSYTYLWNDPSSQTTDTATGLCAGNYIVEVTDFNNCISLDSVIISSNPLPVVVAGNDVIICTGQCTSLSASGADSYVWTPATGLSDSIVSNPIACPSVTTTYIVTGTLGDNLILNGDFEAGNVNFNSAYGYGSPSPGFYYVAPDPSVFNAGHSGSDHTSGSGNFLIVDGSTTPNTNVWCQTVSVIPNTSYSFSAWVNNIVKTSSNFSDPTLQFTINGSPLCGSITLPELPDVWIEVSCSWNSGSDTSAVLCVYSLSTAGLGNDFGIDDISFTGPAGCSNTDSVTLTVSLPPLVTVNTTDNSCNSSCNGTVIANVSGGTSPFTYSWSNGAGNGSSATGLCANTYTVTVTDSNNCADTAIAVVSQPPAMSLILGGVNPSCYNNDGKTFVSVSGGFPPYSYQWNDSALQITDTAINLLSGTYIVNVTDSAGCIATGVISISDAGGPVAVISASSNVSCNGGNNGSATVSASGGTPPFTYLWSDTGNQTTPTATALTANSYSVAVSDSNGCIANANVNITQPPPISISVTFNNVLCNGNCNGSSSASVSGGVPPYTYLWNDPFAQTDSFADSLCPGNFSLLVADSSGCADTSAPVTITEPPLLNPVITNIVNVACFGNCTGSATANTSGGTPSYTYLWNDTFSQTTNTATGLCANTYTVTVTDSNNCVDSVISIINEPPPLSLGTSSVNSSCGQATGSATVSVTGGTAPYSFIWNDSLLQTNDTATGLYAGTYLVKVTDTMGCQDSTFVVVNDIPGPTVLFVTVIDVACNAGANGSASVTVTGGTSPYTYLWNDPGAQTQDTAFGLQAGVYNVTVTDANNCLDTANVTVAGSPGGTASVSLVNDASCNGVCDGSASASITGGTPPYTYLWNDSLSQSGQIASGLCAGTYNVSVTDSNGCLSVANISINEPLPVILSVSGTPSGCDGTCDGTAVVFVSGTTGPYTYLWDIPAGSQTDSMAVSLCPGSYTVTVTDSAYCADSISYTVSISATSFTADFASQDETAPTIVFTNLSLSYLDSLLYLWNFGDGSIDSITHPSHTYKDIGTFAIQLIAMDKSGCSDTIIKYVTIKGDYILFAPNTFTPNGDGKNDMFFPRGIGIDNNNFKMYIYNRWGDEIYFTNDLNKPWDGKANNGANIAQEDVYVWLILTKETGTDNSHRYVGHVTLIR